MSNKNYAYFDNNGSTEIDPQAADTLAKWLRKAKNPSTTSKIASNSKDIINLSKRELLHHCGCAMRSTSNDAYTVIYTSGATESNCFIIKSAVHSYRRLKKVKPNIIVSAIEHESIISCCKSLEEDNLADIIYIMPNIEGSIPLSSIESAITDSCALISVMFANNELGTINNIKEIGALAHRYNIPYHCDAVQGFGKFQINLPRNNIDVVSASFHKLHGPLGLGLLIIRNQLIEGYDLHGLINGTQQNGLRGGTENVPAIASSTVALKNVFKNRGDKNQKLLNMRNHLIEGLSNIFPIGNYSNYVLRALQEEADYYPIEYDPANEGFNEKGKAIYVQDIAPVEIVMLGPPQNKQARYLPNTLTFSIVKNILDKHGAFCNVKLKNALDKKGFVVSIGSACHTDNKEISHVMKAIKMPENVGRGIIRISFGDFNSLQAVKEFLKAFSICCAQQLEKKKTAKSNTEKNKDKTKTKTEAKTKTKTEAKGK